MPSSSLRWRVTSVVVAVAALLVVSVGVVVDVVLEHQLEHQLNAQMSVHAQRATMLIRQGVPPDELVGQLRDRAVLAELREPDGGPVPGSGALSPALRPPMQRVVVPLSNGTQLVLTTDVERLNDEQERLRLLLSTVGGVGLAIAAMAMLVGVRAALRPLDTMAGLAEAITAGDRGRRLRPRDTRTELGRTAAAFDTMLDALETAQAETESARAQAEAARADAEAATAQARDAEAAARRSEITLRRFLADAAHELRTPLTGMQTLAETLVRHPDLAIEPREQVATTLVRETRRATRLVTEMLELARLEGGGPPPQLQPVSPRTLTTLANREVERTQLLAPGLTVKLLPAVRTMPTPKRSAASVTPPATGEPSEPSILADLARLTQILANLLDNARRHTPRGGSITLSVTHTHTDALLTVRDTGPGVSEADRERIFDRLVRLDEARTHDAGGAGLGLPIARALARAHQGDLVYLAEPGGAAFQLRLPLQPDASRAE